MRDEFAVLVRELLAKRVAQRCSNPGCRQPTSGPQEDPAKFVNVGVAAHITAASPTGPRYDGSLTAEQRRAQENGIWLCQTCAKLIDNDEVRYSVEVLREWRARAEADAARDLERRRAPDTDRPFVRIERLLPDLLAEMRKDLSKFPLRREFVLLKKSWTYNASGSEVAYFYDDHPELDGKIRILESSGMVEEITMKNVRRFVLSEDFVDYLTGH